jgi:hypothetical protein
LAFFLLGSFGLCQQLLSRLFGPVCCDLLSIYWVP